MTPVQTYRALTARARDLERAIGGAILEGKSADSVMDLERQRESLVKLRSRYRNAQVTRWLILGASLTLIAAAVAHFTALPDYRVNVEATSMAVRVRSGDAEQQILADWALKRLTVKNRGSKASARLRSLHLSRNAVVDVQSSGEGCADLNVQSGLVQAVFSLDGGGEGNADLERGEQLTLCDDGLRRMLFRNPKLVVIGLPMTAAAREFAPSLVSGQITYVDLGKSYPLSPAAVLRLEPAQAELLVGFGKGLGLSLSATGGSGGYWGPAPRDRFEPTLLEWVRLSPDLRAFIAALSGVLGAAWAVRQKLA